MTVGPESAGADPGPVCYARGNSTPTVTDANLALGYLNPQYLVGGALPIDRDRTMKAIEESLAKPLGMTIEEAAFGVHAIANATMSRALRAVSSERGRDPRLFALMAFGGNGGVHGCSLAASMEMSTVLIPPAAGVFSALGLLFPETQHHYVRTFKRELAGLSTQRLDQAFSAIEQEARLELAGEGYEDRIGLARWVDMRYGGENSELTVEMEPGATIDSLGYLFHAAHERTYGYRSEEEIVEIVNVRVVATGLSDTPRVPESLTVSDPSTSGAEALGRETNREVYFGPDQGWHPTRVISRAEVSGVGIAGPLIVEDYDATTVVPPGAVIKREQWDVLSIQLH
jgi:N-methylhydantoinase A